MTNLNSIDVEISETHIQDNYSQKNPLYAICELIWNGLDADANKIEIKFVSNGTTIESIEISDNGDGIQFNGIVDRFKAIGFSEKRNKEKTKKDRFYHGKKGQGRFFAFSLGNNIEWISRYEEGGKLKQFSIFAQSNNVRKFNYSDSEDATIDQSGVSVIIKDVSENFLKNANLEDVKSQIITEFAQYMSTYKHENIEIIVDGILLDWKSCILGEDEDIIQFHVGENEDTIYEFKYKIYNWVDKSIHKRYLCASSSGHVLYEDNSTSIKEKDFGHSVYVSSPYIDELQKDNTLLLLVDKDEVLKTAKEKVAEKVRDFYLKISEYPAALLRLGGMRPAGKAGVKGIEGRCFSH